jgi:hypothetical protein
MDREMSLDLYLYVDCDDAGDGEEHTLTLADFNITHNVAEMWRQAGCYEALYESHGRIAGDFIDSLNEAVKAMRADPEKFSVLDATNGWGTYSDAFPWLQSVRDAFERYPKAKIRVSR